MEGRAARGACEQIHHKPGFPKATYSIDSWCKLKPDVLCRQRTFPEARQALKRLHALALGAMQVVQPIQQPTAVGPYQRSHIGHRADAEQIPGNADGFWFVQHIGNGMGQRLVRAR